MPLFARAMFGVVRWLASREGLSVEATPEAAEERREPVPSRSGEGRRRTGMRGETFAYWYLRRQGYTIVARNYRLPHPHGEIDLIGWDGKVLAFVEVKTRTTASGGPPERAVDIDKQQAVERLARYYLQRRGLGEIPYRFDVVALEARPRAAPVVRLHKGAFGGN